MLEYQKKKTGQELPEELGKYIWLIKADTSQEAPVSKSGSSSRVSDKKARIFYLTEAAENMWSVRTLDRNISTLYYNRIVASIDKKTVEDEMKEKIKSLQTEEFIKNPVVLEFLDLPTNMSYTENELEKALTDDIQKFINIVQEHSQLQS